MLKVILISFLGFSALSPQAFAQQAPAKVLIVVHSGLDDIFGFGTAVFRAIELKKGGVDVQVIFEGASVLYFLGKDFVTAELSFMPSGPKSPSDGVVAASSVPVVTSTASTAAPGIPAVTFSTATVVPGNPKEAAPRNGLVSNMRRFSFETGPSEVDKMFWDSMAEFEAAGIPYTVCSFSAKFLGKYDKLKKLGRPLSKDTNKLAPIALYVKEGYQVISY